VREDERGRVRTTHERGVHTTFQKKTLMTASSRRRRRRRRRRKSPD
jgi:hypothetical protein